MSRVSCILVMLVFTSGGCNQSEQAAPEAQLSRQAQSAVETSNAAWELWWHDRDVAAIQQGNQALQQFSAVEAELASAPASAALAQARLAQARCALLREEWPDCSRWSGQAISIYRDLLPATSPERLQAEILEAYSRFQQAQDAESFAELERVLQAQLAQGDSPEACISLMWLGRTLAELARNRESRERYEELTQMGQRLEEPLFELHGQLGVATQWNAAGYSEKARALLEQVRARIRALRAAQRYPELSQFGLEVEWTWADLPGQETTAVAALREQVAGSYLTLAEQFTDANSPASAAWAYRHRSLVLNQLEKYDEATATIKQAITLSEELNDPRLEAIFHWNHGSILAAQKKTSEALAELQQTLELAQQVGR